MSKPCRRELFAAGETYGRTHHDTIFVARNGVFHPSDVPHLTARVEALITAAQRSDADEIQRRLQDIVPQYRPARGSDQYPVNSEQ